MPTRGKSKHDSDNPAVQTGAGRNVGEVVPSVPRVAQDEHCNLLLKADKHMRTHAESHAPAEVVHHSGTRTQFLILLRDGAAMMRVSEESSATYEEGRDQYNVAFNWLVSAGGMKPRQVLRLATSRREKREARR